MSKYPIGSISHGTMNPEHLIPTFIDELEYWAKQADNQEHLGLIEEIEDRIENQDDYYESESANEDLDALFDALNEYAAPYFYFGALPDDGSDYGFWLCEDSIDCAFDGMKVEDLSDVPDDYEGEILHVNDHGNISLYVADGKGNTTEIWAIV